MKILTILLYCSIALLFFLPRQAFAVEDPLSVPNNSYGIHILFPSELSDAAKLINSSGGDWGYVTIPIQANDKNLQRWQAFMDQARKLHIIPIIRLATEGDYFNTATWRKPTLTDVLDFANFLNSLTWPTKNHYVVVFNEVNRADEWGGQASPQEYADILSYAVTAFKTKDPEFFVISAGLDNAAINSGATFNEYTFLQQLNIALPGIFNQIDGIASHSYPNPGFQEPPSVQNAESIASFSYERRYIESISDKPLPVFITETGWSQAVIPNATVAQYFQQAFSNVWNDSAIVAVTPFLLKAGSGPFTQFSFVDANGNPNEVYRLFFATRKVKGQPLLSPSVLSSATGQVKLTTKNFSKDKTPTIVFAFSRGAKKMLQWFLHW